VQRAWLVVPALALVAGCAAFALQVPAAQAIALGLLAAGIAGALRALVGETPAAVAGTVIGALVAVATLLELGGDATRHAIAAAAAAWTIAELARTTAPASSPLVAMLPAGIAALLDPSFVALLPIAGARLVTAPWQRPRWIGLAPIAGGLVVLLAILACTGPLGALGVAWTGTVAHPVAPVVLADRLGEALGPICAVAAFAGLAWIGGRGRHAQLALGACVVGTLLVDLRSGGVGTGTVAFAALFAGLAVTRFAATIRLASGQAIAGATLGLLLILPPAWSTLERIAR